MQIDALKAWFLRHRRVLPWRFNKDPYSVWVSEVMLQQTQVAVVIPYFERWMERFPTIEALAEASLDEVIKLWEGLGYYSRARNLYEGAKYVWKNYGGVLPAADEELKKIKGLGPYTVGAILSFAFHQKIAAVDGNVMRVLARFFCVEKDICRASTQRHLRELAENILPDEESWIVNEALIELGATLCMKRPKCHECPIRQQCLAHVQGRTKELPIKGNKVTTESLFRSVAVIQHEKSILVQKGQEGKVMSGLHEFPYFEESQKSASIVKVRERIQQQLCLDVEFTKALPVVNHSFTRYRVRLFPFHYRCHRLHFVEGYQWVSFDDVKQIAFSSGHRRILAHLLQKGEV